MRPDVSRLWRRSVFNTLTLQLGKENGWSRVSWIASFHIGRNSWQAHLPSWDFQPITGARSGKRTVDVDRSL
jgi:hypothetical protein